jgi:hypothetical protein
LARLRDEHSDGNRWVRSAAEMKATLKGIREFSLLMCDHLERKDVVQVAFLALNARDLENLRIIQDDDGRLKNYAALTRRVLAREAKRIQTSEGDRDASAPADPGGFR